MKISPFTLTCCLLSSLLSVTATETVKVYETSRAGTSFAEVQLDAHPSDKVVEIRIETTQLKQSVVGFGGSFTESSAYILDQLSEDKRNEVIKECFAETGARYSLTRTHIASCDFALSNYAYTPEPDPTLANFSIEEDEPDLIPLIKDALNQPGADFKIVASAWTAPIWMKDNHDWNAGALLPEHYSTFARYNLKYLKAYAEKGIDIWGITPLNEPLGNGAQWESMHFTGAEMADYIANHLGPILEESGMDTRIFIYDQNRDEAINFVTPIMESAAAKYVDGIALHWYSTTADYNPEVLDALTQRYPNAPIFQSEGCIDVTGDDEPKGIWLTDDWYWRKEATDWGYYWAEEDAKKDHPVYRPFYRYARDIIGGLNHGFFGWVDWNLVLDFNGGPNHADNFAMAPILIDAENNEVYYSPLFYCMKHFSKFIRPGAHIVKVDQVEEPLMVTAAKNPDGSLVVVAFNMGETDQRVDIHIEDDILSDTLRAQSLKTYVLKN